jgi:hypothetical protein
VMSQATYQRVIQGMPGDGHRPTLQIRPDWYY